MTATTEPEMATLNGHDGVTAVITGRLRSITRQSTRQGNPYVTADLTDGTGTILLLIPPRLYRDQPDILQPGSAVTVSGHLEGHAEGPVLFVREIGSAMVTVFGGPRPQIVCLCGSTRFVDEFNRQRKSLTEAGEIVLSIEVVTTQAREQDPQHANPQLKARLDELHKRKIDLSDYVLVLNVDGYIGESTRSEIDYALSIGKPVHYLEPEDGTS